MIFVYGIPRGTTYITTPDTPIQMPSISVIKMCCLKRYNGRYLNEPLIFVKKNK